MQQIIIETNIEDTVKILDYKLATKIDKKVIQKLTAIIKKDLKNYTKSLFHSSNKVSNYITSKIINNNTGVIRANYIAKWQNSGTKERHPKIKNFLYFETPSGLIRKKLVKGITGKKFMELADNWIRNGKYNDLAKEIGQEVLDKELK